jgi:MFS family permease
LIAALIFLVVFGVHVRSPVMTSYDSRWSIYTAMSLIREGNTDLNEYDDLLREYADYGIDRVGQRAYSIYPIGPVLLAVPFVLVVDRALGRSRGDDLDGRLRTQPELPARIERMVASLIVAATAVLMYLVGGLALDRPASALVLAGVFAFATSAWSTASRALWQHGPSMLMLAAALYLVLRARERLPVIAYVGVPLALAFVMRPTNLISLILFTLFVAWRHRTHLGRYLVGVGLVIAPFAAFNLVVYGAPLPPYYLGSRVALTSHFLEGLAGTVLSPGRGLLVFSPVLVFAIVGAVTRLRAPRGEAVDPWLVAIVLLHWVTIASFENWWGGHSYGPRLFSDMTPYLVYLLVPVMASHRQRKGRRRLLVGLAFVLTTVASVFVHYRGAVSQHSDQWNARPVDIDTAPARVWNWRDPQFLRGVRL